MSLAGKMSTKLCTRGMTRKKKRWTDAIVKVILLRILSSSKSTKVIVYDEEGARQITHIVFCKLQPPGFIIEDDYEFETEKFIVQILNIKNDTVGSMLLPENTSNECKKYSTPQVLRPSGKPALLREAGESLQTKHKKIHRPLLGRYQK